MAMRGCSKAFPIRFLADPAVLAGYVSGRLPNLEDGGTPGSVASTKWISLVASPSPAAFRDYGPIGEWPHGLGRLGLNPLYRSIPRAGGFTLQLELPTEWFEFENAECRSYMPERIDVDRGVLEDVAAQRRTPEVEALIRQCVVLGLPESYG